MNSGDETSLIVTPCNTLGSAGYRVGPPLESGTEVVTETLVHDCSTKAVTVGPDLPLHLSAVRVPSALCESIRLAVTAFEREFEKSFSVFERGSGARITRARVNTFLVIK